MTCDVEIEDIDDECYYLMELHEAETKIKRLQEQKQKVIALIKDGRFVEALQELENETLA